MHCGSWCSVPRWPLMYINTTTLHLLAGLHHSLAKRGGIEKQSLFLLEPRSRSFIVSHDRAAATPLQVLHLHVQCRRPLGSKNAGMFHEAGFNVEYMRVESTGGDLVEYFSLLILISSSDLPTTDDFSCPALRFLIPASKRVKDLHFISCIFLIMSLSGSAQRSTFKFGEVLIEGVPQLWSSAKWWLPVTDCPPPHC